MLANRFTTAVGDFISFAVKEPGLAAPTVVGHTLRIRMGGAFGEHAWVHKAVDRWLRRRAGGRTCRIFSAVSAVITLVRILKTRKQDNITQASPNNARGKRSSH